MLRRSKFGYVDRNKQRSKNYETVNKNRNKIIPTNIYAANCFLKSKKAVKQSVIKLKLSLNLKQYMFYWRTIYIMLH